MVDLAADDRESRRGAYSFLSAAMLHLKWDLAGFWAGLSLSRPWRLLGESRQVRRAAHRAVAFHNLAISLTHDLDGFEEGGFWAGIEAFQRRHPDDWANYRRMFERKIAGETVPVVMPGG